MTPLLLMKGTSSLKAELRILAGVLALLIFLPLVAVVVIANAGVAEVAATLVSVNPTTHQVEIHDPNGKLVSQIEASTVWPVQGIITLEFGMPDLPFQLYHTGIDIANKSGKIGDPITPFMAGTVVSAGPVIQGCGLCVLVDHGNNITSIYMHMSAVQAVAGQVVKPGDVIGLEGATGWATGPHVHFEVRVNGVPVNPRAFMVGDPAPGPSE